MYNYEYVNKLDQFGFESYTLILTDLDGINPTIRIEKSFDKELNTIDESFLETEAQKDIAIVLIELENQHLKECPCEDEVIEEEVIVE